MSSLYENEIEKFMLSLGMNPDTRGYSYITYAIFLAVNDTELMHRVTSRIYPMVAEHFNTTPSSVEKAINRIIRVIERSDENRVKLCLPSTELTLTNASFIARVARIISLNH